MNTFIKKLKEVRQYVRVIVTGAGWGHVASVIPKDQTEVSRKGFASLLAVLGGTLVGGAVAIFRSIRIASSSQILGVHVAKPSSNPQPSPTAIYLYGYCLQARRKFPESEEEYEIIEPEEIDLPSKPLLLNAIKEGEKQGLALADEYAFIDEAELFARRFTQSLVWVITDDIGYLRVKNQIFGEEISKIMFFIPSCFEILLWLRECLKKIDVDIKSTRFDKELMLVVLRLNIKLGLVGQEKLEEWQKNFGFEATL